MSAFADEPLPVQLRVGEKKALVHLVAPICDDPSVATLSGAGDGVVTGVGPGKTLCSGATLTRQRQVYEVTVTADKTEGKTPAAH